MSNKEINTIISDAVNSTLSEAPEIKDLVSKFTLEISNNDLTEAEQKDRIDGIIKGLTALGAAAGANVALRLLQEKR